ncbi:hypothetical protein LLB_2929 [Legionella longbeachae D-4968]|nr:hypothetical protein LLB_2929 [Legionella longbeachae D-4968]
MVLTINILLLKITFLILSNIAASKNIPTRGYKSFFDKVDGFISYYKILYLSFYNEFHNKN